MKKCRKEKKGLLSRTAVNCKHAGAVLSRSPRIEITADREAIVYGVRCICDYTNERIVLRHKCGKVSFCGSCLSCDSFVEGAVCVRGSISSVHYCE